MQIVIEFVWLAVLYLCWHKDLKLATTVSFVPKCMVVITIAIGRTTLPLPLWPEFLLYADERWSSPCVPAKSGAVLNFWAGNDPMTRQSTGGDDGRKHHIDRLVGWEAERGRCHRCYTPELILTQQVCRGSAEGSVGPTCPHKHQSLVLADNSTQMIENVVSTF